MQRLKLSRRNTNNFLFVSTQIHRAKRLIEQLLFIVCVYYLVIHPDKTTHSRAPDAFDLIKKVS